jgi:hypothetical protein
VQYDPGVFVTGVVLLFWLLGMIFTAMPWFVELSLYVVFANT